MTTSTHKHRLLHLVLPFALLFLVPMSADAQWYLFPGGRNKENKEKTRPSSTETEVPIEAPAPNLECEIKDTAATEEEDGASFFEPFWSRDRAVDVTLALPIGADGEKANSNFIEMYAGALLAARDLGKAGIEVRLKLVDAGGKDFSLSTLDIGGSDIFIGPVSYNDISEALTLCSGRGDVLISPLEPKTATLAGENESLIHAPVSWKYQTDELVRWVKEDLQFGEELIVVLDSSESGHGEQCSYLLNLLSESGLEYRSVGSVYELNRAKTNKYRILIASDSDSFLVGAARAAAIDAARGANITLYCTSRVRGNLNINDTDLYKASAHLTAAYYIDYDSEDVRNFILSYRSLFQGEPGSFAFQGYDLVNFFVRAYSENGRRWVSRLPEHHKRGLQSDFRFNREECEGRVNTGVRRVVYSKDLSCTLLP